MPKRRVSIPFPKTLWDFLRPPPRPAAKNPPPKRPPPPPPPPRPKNTPGISPGPTPALPRPAPASMAHRYEAMTRAMLARYAVRVRKWRSSMSGVAWQVTYADGSVARLIEAPRPKGPMSAAIFLHEIGHHAIGFGTYKPRCLEEFHAWKFALETMEAEGLTVTERVRTRMRDSLRYAVAKARRRGLKRIPAELAEYQ